MLLKDGAIYGELHKGRLSHSQFFQDILAVLENLGGYSGCIPDSV